MTREQSIEEFGAWLRSAPGRHLLGWEEDRLDHAVTDAFGFHAVQLGLAEVQALRANRMPHRWVVTNGLTTPATRFTPPQRDGLVAAAPAPAPKRISLHCEFDALPFPNASIDLVVLPHTLELSGDPHQTLREVERVLVPDGRVVIAGFNPASLWGLRQRAGHLRHGMGLGRDQRLFLPSAGEFIGYWRLRDWLRLLSFEVESGRFGCWRPPLRSETWLERFAWMDRAGDRWWPVLGAVYFLVAVKRVRGMRLVGLARQERRRPQAAPAVVANSQRERAELECR